MNFKTQNQTDFLKKKKEKRKNPQKRNLKSGNGKISKYLCKITKNGFLTSD